MAQVDVDRFAFAIHVIDLLAYRIEDRHMVEGFAFHGETAHSRIREHRNLVGFQLIDTSRGIINPEEELVVIMDPIGGSRGAVQIRIIGIELVEIEAFLIG